MEERKFLKATGVEPTTKCVELMFLLMDANDSTSVLCLFWMSCLTSVPNTRKKSKKKIFPKI